MIYISIPVNESFDAIVNQAQNFARYFPEAKLVFHLSTSAYFSIKDLESLFKLNHITNSIINPVQLDTAWGDIFRAHLENVVYILSLGNATKVAFHSSNDMLVREGVANYLADKDYVFHNRKILKDSYWWPANSALQDFRLTDWLVLHNGGALMASQIEGSVYPIDFLRELVDELLYCHPVLESPSHYPREEIIFSSFAHAKNITAQGLPYIFSEVHRFDKALWRSLNDFPQILNDDNLLNKKIKREFIKELFDAKFYKISIKDIEAIRKQDKNYLKKFEIMSDGNNIWQVHTTDNLFGVKRVEREMTNPIRQYITR